MANRGGSARNQARTAEQQFEWFKHSASRPDLCDEWDIKTEPFRDAVLGLLSLGKAVMFGCSRDGGSISVTIYDGDAKAREWVADSIEFDDLMQLICTRVEARKSQDEPQKIRAVGN